MVTEEKIQLTSELSTIGNKIQGIREVQTLYGEMQEDNYEILLIANRDQLETVKQRVDDLISMLSDFPNEEGNRQFVLMVNGLKESNKPFFFDKETKNGAIQVFKGAIEMLDDESQEEFLAKETELAEI